MPQRKYPFVPQGYYHIFNRGHNKQTIFLDERDYKRYLKRLKEYLEKHPVTLLAYCLMPNHVHLLLRQETDEPIERFIHRLHTAYTMYFNKKYERVGSVFQGRFKAKPIETDEHLLHVSRYIHINPIDSQAQGPALSLELEKYPWSSYNEYVNSRSNRLCNPATILNYFSTMPMRGQTTYKSFVEEYLGVVNADRLVEISNGNL